MSRSSGDPVATGFFAWSDDYALGVEEIDAQHRTFVELIDRLYRSMEEGTAAAGAADAVRGIARYAREHFDTEERLMAGIAGADFAAHRAAHSEFFVRADHCLARLEAGAPVSPLDLAGFLRDWLARHILKVDRGLAEAIRARG